MRAPISISRVLTAINYAIVIISLNTNALLYPNLSLNPSISSIFSNHRSYDTKLSLYRCQQTIGYRNNLLRYTVSSYKGLAPSYQSVRCRLSVSQAKRVQPLYSGTDDNVHTENSLNVVSTTDQSTANGDSTSQTPVIASNSWFASYGFLVLNAVAVIWGSQHVIIKSAVQTFPLTSLVNFWRFLLSAVIFSPALINYLQLSRKSQSSASNPTNNDRNAVLNPPTIVKNQGVIRAGTELGIYTFLGFAFQAIGLETTTASRSAFLLYLNVKFVPIISFLLFRQLYPLSTWISALFAVIGTVLLSTDGGTMPNIGDVWSIAAAVVSALFILRIGKFSNQYDAALLNSISFALGKHGSIVS